jgi:cysteine synthase A
LVEATSGNTGISLAAIGATLGNKVKIIMPSNMSEERRSMMRFFGAEIIEVAPYDFAGAIKYRNELVAEGGWSPMQFENKLNIQCHKNTTAKEIFEQLSGNTWGAFVSGAGTGGTMMGIAAFVAENDLDTKLIFMRPEEEEHGIQGIGDGGDYLMNVEHADATLKIKTEDAKLKMISLSRELGVPVGISSAANVLAAEQIRLNKSILGEVVTIICDRGERYISDDDLKRLF